MRIFDLILGIALILLVLLDAFETVVLPRRIKRQFRLTSWFYRNTWRPWARMTSHITSPSRRENFLGYFGPLSLIALLILWAFGLILSFALLQYGAGEHIQISHEPITFGRLMYQSGETFFTLGYGDILPISGTARLLAVLEAGLGFGFLAIVIGYLPTIYSAFSKREVQISLLDARAGSPPTAAELLARFGKSGQQTMLDQILLEWERWAAEVLESHLSYPVLSFFRSQHNNQSWLGALTAILDASAVIIAGIEGVDSQQAKLTFAVARHAVVDLAQVVNARYDPLAPDRLPVEEMARLRQKLKEGGLQLGTGDGFDKKLASLRALYESYAHAIGRNLYITLPPWIHPDKKRDNWQGGPWDRIIQARGLAGLGRKPETVQTMDEHF